MTARNGLVSIRREPWTKDETVEVLLVVADPGINMAKYDVFTPDGAALGQVTKYMSELNIKIPNSRLRREAKRRPFWMAEVGTYRVGRLLESRAEAIRCLLQEAGL